MRLQDTPDSAIIVTATPKQGMHGWEQEVLAEVSEGPHDQNLSDPDDLNSPPYVEMFEIDQFKAGIAPHKQIRASMQTMTDFEIAACIHGKPVALSENPVFDKIILNDMLNNCKPAELYDMVLDKEVELADVTSHDGNY